MSEKIIFNTEILCKNNNSISTPEAKYNAPMYNQSIWTEESTEQNEIGDFFCSNISESDKVSTTTLPSKQATPSTQTAKPSRPEILGLVTDSSRSMIDDEKKEIRENYTDECRMIETMLNKLLEYRKISNTHKNTVCVEFWAEKVGKLSKKYNMPAEVITAIIANSCAFLEKPPTKVFVNSRINGELRDKTTCGVMHTEPKRIMDFFPGENGNNYDQYKIFASDLLHDILYDSDNNLKYDNCEDLINACNENQELSIMVGILIYKAEEILALEEIMTGNKNPDLEIAINNLTKNIEYLSEKFGENKSPYEFVQDKALKRYFGCPVKGRIANVYSRLSTTAPKSISE